MDSRAAIEEAVALIAITKTHIGSHRPAPDTDDAAFWDRHTKAIDGLLAVLAEKAPSNPDILEQKQPIGLRPKVISDSHRRYEILGAMQRYADVGKGIPTAWVAELTNLQPDNGQPIQPARADAGGRGGVM